MPHDPSIFSRLADAVADDWTARARPEQLPPPGDYWSIWLLLAGRGFGKTRAAAEFVRAEVNVGRARRVAIVGATSADVRDICIEGQSGLLNICTDRDRPTFETSKRRVTWSNGAIATLYSAEEWDRLRGPQHDLGWCDELCSWSNSQATWDQLMFGLRLGARPRVCVSTTPRPIRLLKELVARPDAVVTRGSTFDNSANLPPSFFSSIVARYQGTRLGRQELSAEILEDVAGSLWPRDLIEGARLPDDRVPEMRRVVVAVDPSGARGADDDGADSIGIVVAGLGVDDRAYVLEDCTVKDSPAGWGRRAVSAFRRWRADRIIAERNFGGAMVQHVIRTTDPNVSFREVTASRGKIARAEPIAALFEQGRVSILPGMTALEDQLAGLTSDGYVGGGSPDRADAMVWALHELMLSLDQTVYSFHEPWGGPGRVVATEIWAQHVHITDASDKPGGFSETDISCGFAPHSNLGFHQ